MCLQTFQVSEEKQTVKRGERNPCPEGIFNDDQTIEKELKKSDRSGHLRR